MIDYCKNKLEFLLANKVRPILIFEGARLQMNRNTEEKRAKSRAETMEKAKSYFAESE